MRAIAAINAATYCKNKPMSEKILSRPPP